MQPSAKSVSKVSMCYKGGRKMRFSLLFGLPSRITTIGDRTNQFSCFP